MGFLDMLKSMFTPSSDPMVLWLYVKCKRCGAPIAVRVDLRNDPSLNDDASGYVLVKEIMDNKCFLLMRAEVQFDAHRNVIEKKIDKGDWIDRAEYERLKNTVDSNA